MNRRAGQQDEPPPPPEPEKNEIDPILKEHFLMKAMAKKAPKKKKGSKFIHSEAKRVKNQHFGY